MLVDVALDGVLVGVGVVVWFRNIERVVDCCVIFSFSPKMWNSFPSGKHTSSYRQQTE
jgi:hypothetical protein